MNFNQSPIKLLTTFKISFSEDIENMDEYQIKDNFHFLGKSLKYPEDMIQKSINLFFTQNSVKMDLGFALKEENDPWFDQKKSDIDFYYWNRLQAWLFKTSFSVQIISKLNRNTDEILNLIGNPFNDSPWKKRGLVVGDVQSGKTLNYSSIICKAADAGYKFIILMTGTIETLRRQTQERLDNYFIGLDTNSTQKINKNNLYVGVGEDLHEKNAISFTSTTSDFKSMFAINAFFSLNALREPALVVIKKNTKILNNLFRWIQKNNSLESKTNLPLLMIDDEADNASLNTKEEIDDPTKTNELIRKILSQFHRSTYIGFTATPFANIFINPDKTDKMLEDDLFPKDFIYTIQSPSNYLGPKYFFSNDNLSPHIQIIDDIESYIPSTHKIDHDVHELPKSLHEAIYLFLLANTIQDIKYNPQSHRSMLVNISHYTNVQNQVSEKISDLIKKINHSLRNYSSLPLEESLCDIHIQKIKDCFEKHYSHLDAPWQNIMLNIYNSSKNIQVSPINSHHRSDRLNFKKYSEGLRIITIGGNSLSRGLTLEGLVISYFRRTTKMYDTLLQMGRWFGYRDEYKELCKIFMPQETIDWYGYISESTEELKHELKKMYISGKTPKDFGLAVRAHPESLLVTARNKMRTAKNFTRSISISCQLLESVEIVIKNNIINNNYQITYDLIKKIKQNNNDKLILNINKNLIAQYLRKFQSSYSHILFQPESIADLLEDTEDSIFSYWDIFIAEGKDEQNFISIDNMEIKKVFRTVSIDIDTNILTFSKQKRRVGSRGIEKNGLSQQEIEQAKTLAYDQEIIKAFEEKRDPIDINNLNIADKFYRQVRKKPLLVIYFVDILKNNIDSTYKAITDPIVALSLSFPKTNENSTSKYLTYKINIIKAREIFGCNFDEDDQAMDESYEN